MVKIWINKQNQVVHAPIPQQEFYARPVEVSEEVKEAIDRILAEYSVLAKWSSQTYQGLNTRNPDKVPAFPEELLNSAKKQEKNTSKKGGTKKRVRAGSSGDTEAEGGNV